MTLFPGCWPCHRNNGYGISSYLRHQDSFLAWMHANKAYKTKLTRILKIPQTLIICGDEHNSIRTCFTSSIRQISVSSLENKVIFEFLPNEFSSWTLDKNFLDQECCYAFFRYFTFKCFKPTVMVKQSQWYTKISNQMNLYLMKFIKPLDYFLYFIF